jgi:ribosomal protein S20
LSPLWHYDHYTHWPFRRLQYLCFLCMSAIKRMEVQLKRQKINTIIKYTFKTHVADFSRFIRRQLETGFRFLHTLQRPNMHKLHCSLIYNHSPTFIIVTQYPKTQLVPIFIVKCHRQWSSIQLYVHFFFTLIHIFQATSTQTERQHDFRLSLEKKNHCNLVRKKPLSRIFLCL